MFAETYSQLEEDKVLEEAAVRSGILEGVIKAAWTAAGEVIKAWCVEGHTVAVPGLGTMRFSVNANAVENAEDVNADLVHTRKIIFTPTVKIKNDLKNASINITCYDEDGKIVKRVQSADSGEIEGDESNPGETDTII